MEKIKKLFRWFTSKTERSEWYKLEEVKEGWYKYKNELEMPISRMQALQLAEIGMDWNISKDDISNILNESIELLSKNKATDAIYKLSALKEKISLVLSRDMLIEVCCIFYIYKDEPLNEYNPEWQNKKRKILQNNRALSDFFLQHYLQTCKNLNRNLVIDSQNYLFQTAADSMRLNKTLKIGN